MSAFDLLEGILLINICLCLFLNKNKKLNTFLIGFKKKCHVKTIIIDGRSTKKPYGFPIVQPIFPSVPLPSSVCVGFICKRYINNTLPTYVADDEDNILIS